VASFRVTGILLLALSFAACERRSAPQARDAAIDAARELEASSPGTLGWWTLLDRGIPLSLYSDSAPRALEIDRDGRTEAVRGFVLENTFVPPAGLGTPRTRRTFVAWPDAHTYYVLGMSELNPSPVEPMRSFDEQTNWYRPRAFLTLRKASVADGWVARSGSFQADTAVWSRECPDQFIRAERAEHADTTDRVTCELGLFPVTIDGTFVLQRDDTARTEDLRKSWHRLRVPTQLVPGVRFTTYCADVSPAGRDRLPGNDRNWCLANHAAFWRDQHLFDRSVVEVTQMSNDSVRLPYRRIVAGLGHLDDARWVYRWTFRAPNGRLLEHDSAVVDLSRNPRIPPRYEELQNILSPPVNWRGHNQYLVPESLVNPHASVFSFVVLDVERVPLSP